MGLVVQYQREGSHGQHFKEQIKGHQIAGTAEEQIYPQRNHQKAKVTTFLLLMLHILIGKYKSTAKHHQCKHRKQQSCQIRFQNNFYLSGQGKELAGFPQILIGSRGK